MYSVQAYSVCISVQCIDIQCINVECTDIQWICVQAGWIYSVHSYSIYLNGGGNGSENGRVMGSNNQSRSANLNKNDSHSGEQRGGDQKAGSSLTRRNPHSVNFHFF